MHHVTPSPPPCTSPMDPPPSCASLVDPLPPPMDPLRCLACCRHLRTAAAYVPPPPSAACRLPPSPLADRLRRLRTTTTVVYGPLRHPARHVIPLPPCALRNSSAAALYASPAITPPPPTSATAYMLRNPSTALHVTCGPSATFRSPSFLDYKLYV